MRHDIILHFTAFIVKIQISKGVLYKKKLLELILFLKRLNTKSKYAEFIEKKPLCNVQ